MGGSSPERDEGELEAAGTEPCMQGAAHMGRSQGFGAEGQARARL
jgi:hypothetical protein